MKLFVSGFSPIDQYVEEEIKIRRANFQELVVQKLESTDILKNPTYIQNDDVLICGATIFEVFKKINVRGQLVPLRVQTSDFLKALGQAALVGEEVNIINYKEVFLKNDLAELERVFNVKIHQYYYPDTESADALIDELLEKKQSIVIGSGLIVSKALEKGMKGFIWYGKESVKVAVDIAFNLLLTRFEEQSNHKRQEYILDHFNDGVISLNVVGRIIQINQKAVELLGLQKYRDIRGLSIKEIDEFDFLSEYLKNSASIKDKLLEYQNKTLYINSFPITVKGENDGSVIIISDAVEIQKHEKKIRRKLYDDSNRAIYEFDDIIGKSEVMEKLKYKAKKFAKTDANVLIIGESGTGKELFAQSIHNASSRSKEPFIAINCAAIPENLMESEFFGYNEGAFTGAIKGGKPGLFELAHKGTVFLDELGEIPLSMQSKLLRILQERVVRRVGSATSIPIDVRIIAATNVNLLEQVRQGKFRLDLFYRISVLNLKLPSLNERKQDLEDLVLSYTLRKHPNFMSVIERWIKEITKQLNQYQWKGNIRELENNLERFFAYLESPVNITKQDVLNNLIETLEDNNFLSIKQVPDHESYQTIIKEAEINTIKRVLKKTNGNKKDAAEILGMSRSTLWRKLSETDASKL
ncbi:propionate catabolism operon transcriptional regulator [Neobacillus bataviensis]|uniref:Propionate catabolism operon transcriptional regulator n=1 Tax=Neobacillus bataviensis TaxID=220685 RepID=A0A561CFH5_9BACI|nr:sigma 54-interacting transcriptional regulator [Neobacillus bataviensis]TWD89618.1 propionate catabolism operon transcriptional regulator [Neobacillus bataviensis]